jgi:CHASE2 domain-containing sensor protein
MTKLSKKAAKRKRIGAPRLDAPLKVEVAKAIQPKSPETEKDRPFKKLKSVIWPIAFSLFVAFLLSEVKERWLDSTDLGQQLDQFSARLLQVRLSDTSGWRGDPVTIVDISSLPLEPRLSAGETVNVVPRAALQQSLDLIAQASPKAIGIDVIFDPEPAGLSARKEDDQFLEHCKNLRDPSGRLIPVRVGIYKSLALGRDSWLGSSDFGDLGASIIVPNEDRQNTPTGHMIRQFHFSLNNQTVVADSLSYSLARIAQDQAVETGAGATHRAIGNWLKLHLPELITEPDSIQHGAVHVVKADRFLVDFGVVPKLKESTIPVEDLNRRYTELHDKIVLVGRTAPSQARDVFATTLSDKVVSGVYTHAAAVDTLMEAPLFILSDAGNNWINIITTVFLVACAVLMYIVFDLEKHKKVRDDLEIAIPFFLAVLVIIVGYSCVDATGIFWPGFLLFAFMLIIGTQTGAVIEIAWKVPVGAWHKRRRKA